LVGEQIEYVYSSGLLISYSAISQPEYIIARVQISKGGFIELADGTTITTGERVDLVFDNYPELMSSNWPKTSFSIHVDRVDVTRIYVEIVDQFITDIQVIF
jgi:hypothetical protein